MRASRIRALQMLGCLACGALALRPVPRVDAAVDMLLVSTRLLAGLAAPLSGWGLAHKASNAAADGLSEVEAHERLQREVLEQAVRRSAEPSRELGGGVVPVHAEVIGRPRGLLDTLEVRVDRVGLVQVGQPVVVGDVYVGTVSSVSLGVRSGVEVEFVEVQLVTGRAARIGGVVLDEETGEERARVVVGGLLQPADFGLQAATQVLCVHYPSLRSLRGGRLVVSDPEGPVGAATDHNYLANGFSLGRLITAENPDELTRERLLGARAEVDYATGLYQVLVLTRPRAGDAPLSEEQPRWARADLALRADAALGRAGRKLLRGQFGDVQPGAAVAAGLRLYGRVQRVGAWTSDVRTLADPGLALPGLAVFAGADGSETEIHVLGRLVSKGRTAGDKLLFHWAAALPLDGERPRAARIWTGSGEAGMDRGLLLGDTLLPVGPGPHELVLTPPPGPREPSGLRVRLRDVVAGGER